MFSTAKRELRELLDLTRQVAIYDATLTAKPDIIPETSATERRRIWGLRTVELLDKYELL